MIMTRKTFNIKLQLNSAIICCVCHSQTHFKKTKKTKNKTKKQPRDNVKNFKCEKTNPVDKTQSQQIKCQ